MRRLHLALDVVLLLALLPFLAVAAEFFFRFYHSDVLEPGPSRTAPSPQTRQVVPDGQTRPTEPHDPDARLLAFIAAEIRNVFPSGLPRPLEYEHKAPRTTSGESRAKKGRVRALLDLRSTFSLAWLRLRGGTFFLPPPEHRGVVERILDEAGSRYRHKVVDLAADGEVWSASEPRFLVVEIGASEFVGGPVSPSVEVRSQWEDTGGRPTPQDGAERVQLEGSVRLFLGRHFALYRTLVRGWRKVTTRVEWKPELPPVLALVMRPEQGAATQPGGEAPSPGDNAGHRPALHKVDVVRQRTDPEDPCVPPVSDLVAIARATDAILDAKLVPDAGRSRRLPPAGAAATVSLSDLEPIVATVGHGDLFVDSFRGQHPLKLNGRVHEKGLDAHAPSCLAYWLGGRFSRLQGTAGLWDSGNPERGLPGDAAGKRGSVEFDVGIDGRVLWRSPLMEWDSGAETFNLDIEGASLLVLRVWEVEDARFDWSVWAGAELLPAAPGSGGPPGGH